MGWDSGFEYTKKFSIETNYNDFNCVETYLTWKNNEWNFQADRYPTFESYVKAFRDEDDAKNILETYKIIDESYFNDICKFYNTIKEKNEEYSYNVKNFGTWDAQKYLDGYICSNLKRVSENAYIGIDKEFVEKAREWVERKLEENCLIPTFVNKCYKENDDDTTTIVKCDGLVVDDGHTQRLVYTNDEEYGSLIYVPSAKYNEDEYYCLKQFKEALTKLEILVRDNTNLIWYYRSY